MRYRHAMKFKPSANHPCEKSQSHDSRTDQFRGLSEKRERSWCDLHIRHQSFISQFGKRAVKLYADIYGRKPRLKRSRSAKRNHVSRFPCGILEQVYKQLQQEGVSAGAIIPH